MQPFINQITTFLLAQNHPVHQWVVIVPSQRAVRYIQKSLFEQAGKPMLAPKIITINRFFETISPRHISDKTRLLIRLYYIHQKHTSSTNKTFDDFFLWGKTLLSDFNEIDSYLINSKQLFKNLRDIKEIENWSFNAENLSETQLKFIQFWNELGVYYNEFEQELLKTNTSYSGKAIREITEHPDWIFKKYPNEKFLFAGFNAHNPAELSIIKQLMTLGKADILFDADDYYMNNGLHEAGAFIRHNLEQLGIPRKLISFKNNLAQKTLPINILSCPQLTGQVKAAASILESLSEEAIAETLILLADEDLLVPLLKNIPAKVGRANITLGLSLDNSILKTWIELIFKIQKGLQTNKSAYHKDLFEICYHPLIEVILTESEKQELVLFELAIKTKNLIYVNPLKISVPEKLKPIIELIYTDWKNDWASATRLIRQVNLLIYQILESENEYEKALLETFDKSIIDLQNCLSEEFPVMSLSTFKIIFTQHYASETIAYYGNPLDGLQIMGLLETRMLDFKRIIVIGMNEKNMPPSNQINSLIPMDLRRYFGMPTVREKQGIFAHHFYRLLHEVEEMYITYSANQQDFNSSEKSRYIMQLELELSQINPAIQFNYLDYTIQNTQVDVNAHTIKKNDYNKTLVKNYLISGVSASGLGNYIACPLNFFYENILKFRDEIKVEEDLESNTFGTLMHKVLEDLYQPYTNHTLTNKSDKLIAFNEDVRIAFSKVADYELAKLFKEFFNSEKNFETGKNRLSFEMSKKLMHNFLNYEKKHLQDIQSNIYVEALETKLTAEIPNIQLGENGETVTIRLNGVIDRIDYHNGGYHIIDYKSGAVDYKKIILSKYDIESLYTKCLGDKKFLQLYFYLYLFYKTYQTYPDSITFVSFISTQKIQSFQNTGDNFESMILLFPEVLQRIINSIFDNSVAFEHTKKQHNYCKYCG